MDGANNDSDQSLTWEDFFGSTTDLTPTLIGIYDSLLEPPLQPVDPSTFPATKDVKHPTKRDEVKRKMAPPISNSPSKDPRLIAGGIKLPGLSKEESSKETAQPQNVNKETANTKMSYVSRFKSFALRKNNSNEIQDEAVQCEEVISSNSGASKTQPPLRLAEKVVEKDPSVAESVSERVNVISKLNSEVIAKVESSRKNWLEKSVNSSNSFDNLSPNVKRMLNSAGGDSPVPKSSIVQPKKSGLATVGRSSYRSRQSNIPLMGATSKITQSGVEIVSTADYDRPTELTASLTRINVRSNLPTTPGSTSNGSFVSPIKSSLMNRVTNEWSSATNVSSFSPEKKQKKSASSDVEDIYDIPLNSSAIYDVPKSNKKAAINVETKTSEEVQNTTKRKLIDVDVNDSKDSDDFVLLESPKKFNDDFVIIDSPEKMAKPEIIEEEIKVTHDKISPSKPAALNIALALRSLGDMPDQKPKDFQKSRNPGVVAQHPNTSMLYSQGCGSVANLKTQSNDERNNLTNVTNVARPLSMSSIASSSSTSSSGAQNKGVNSAYLASIESLDDHSDVDNSVSFAKNARLVQAAEAKMARDSKDGGINEGGITLARASTPPRPRYCDPSMSLLQRVCTEIVDTEGIYVEDLRQVVEGYLYLWRECGTFSPDDLDQLFSNIEEIYHFNRTFSEQLQRCHLEPGSIARCFVLHSDGFRIYSRYCTGYPDTMAALARLAGERGAALQLRARQAALGHPLPLGSYLLKPVQRILKYHLLLQNLVKQCMSHETEYALHKMTGIAQHINDMKKRHEHTVRVQEIQSLLYGWHEQDLTTYGELCAEGTFRVFGAKAMRHAFLFDKMLLLTKNKEYGILAYKSHIMCNNLMLVESIQGQPLSFHVIPFDCPRMQVTLQARNIQHKREWTLLLKRVILENYNAVIPSHARQLVMELGQNKTDDDILAEKSSTLISHSSMRKQLSAPEYLEKRKLERERRKSFESGLRHRLKRSQRKGQNPDEASGNNESEKDKHIRTDSAYDDDICDCHNNSCSNVDCSNYELCKDCKNQRVNGYLCSNCRSNSVYLCKSCQAERSNYSDSNYDCDEFESTKCRRCDEFQSQSSLDVASDKKLKCSECNKSFNYADEQGSRENIRVCMKCERNDSFECSTEEVSKKNNFERCPGCNGKGIKNSCNDFSKKQFDMLDLAEDRMKNRESINLKKTCLKCQEIRENIIVEDNLNYSSDAVGQSFKCEHELADLKAKRGSKDDSQTLLNVPKSTTGTLRRKSEPGMSNINFDPKDWKKSVEMSKCAKSQEELTKDEKSFEGRCADCGRINVTCSNCGRATSIRLNFTCKHSKSGVEIDGLKTGVERKCRSLDREANPLNKKLDVNNSTKSNTLEVKMYNSKTVPKKISKIKKNRAKTLRHLAVDSTAKFYTDFATDNVLHISESTDSINTLNSHKNDGETNAEKDQREINKVGTGIPGGEAEDEVYRSLIQKTDSFKQSEIDKDKTLVKKDVNEPLETFTSKIKTAAKSGSASPKSKKSDIEDDAFESCDDGHEKPLEQIISQLLMQNREFQKILKRHQLRNATNRRHQRLLKSHSNPEKVLMQARESQAKVRPKYGRQTSAVESLLHNIPPLDISDSEKIEIAVESKDDCILPSVESIEDIVKPVQRRRPVEERIYETLISPEKNATKQSIDSPEKSSPSVVPCLSTFAPLNNERSPKKLDDTLQNSELPLGKQTRVSLSESDYVYLCFDGNKNIDAYRVPSNIKKIDDFEDNGEYAVPSSTPQKVKKDEVERRLVRDKIDKECRTKETDLENNYDEGSDVWKRISNDTVIENPALKNRRNKDNLNNINIDDYLEVENGPQSPNMPEIWLKSQKEHFTTPRDKKSGSLPRSFQVNLNEAEENSSQSIAKNKPSVYNKVYLNREGKVLQNDRPFTIASDFSEISYEDIERFIKGDDNSALKFPCDLTISNRSSRSFVEGDSIDEALDCRSRSTLELEEEIDRCYKNNFEMRREQLGSLNNTSNNNLLLSTQMMDQSISSSMEVMNEKSQNCNSQEDIPTSVHPEHKIYKTTANVLSLKSVLNRFKLKGRSNQEQSAANTEKDNAKDVKKTDAKKTATPKNNSRNLMQRFKSIINDEQHENNVAEALNLTLKDINCENKDIVKNVERKNSKGEVVRKNSKGDGGRKNSITVLVTQPDDSPDKNNLVQSKSFSETTDQGKMASSISKSCNNITSPYKSTDCLAANVVEMSQSAQFPNMNQGLKSAQSSVQDLNKLPIYKQGSRHLGARIAQSDYADPKALFLGDMASDLDNVNVFINKNALRPDSLLSNSSHFTSSSEGYANTHVEASKNNSFLYRDSSSKSFKSSKDIQIDQTTPIKQEDGKILSQKRTAESKRFQFKIDSDESFYEKSFDEMENMFGNEIFRDSAIYSDPEDAITHGTDRRSNATLTRSVSITKRTSFVSSNIVKSERVDGAKRISGELFKTAPENFVKNEMPIITSTSYLSSVEHVLNPNTDLKRTASIKDKSKEVENSFLNSLTPSPLKTTPVKPAPPVPVKPQFKPNILQGIKCPTVIKSFETPPLNTMSLDTSKNDIIKPRFSTYNREKHLSASLKITEHDLTEKPAMIKIEQHVAELDGPQHEVSGKLNLCIKLPEKPQNVFQFPSPKSPTDKFKPGIPRPSNERTNSSNIQMKRMSFERCSLDSATISRRSKSVTSCETDTKNEKLTSISVQDRKKEIESITLNEQNIKNKISNRKSADFLTEHSSLVFNRSPSMKMTSTNNISNKDQTNVSSSIKNSIPIYKQKCNIPLPHSSSGPKHSSLSFDRVDNTNNPSDSCEAENKVKDVQNSSNNESNNCNENKSETGEDNSKGGWVKHIVNRFQ